MPLSFVGSSETIREASSQLLKNKNLQHRKIIDLSMRQVFASAADEKYFDLFQSVESFPFLLYLPMNNFDFSEYFKNGLPNHINDIDQDFLEWFVGFAEGDGSFFIRSVCKVEQNVSTGYCFQTNEATGKTSTLRAGQIGSKDDISSLSNQTSSKFKERKTGSF